MINNFSGHAEPRARRSRKPRPPSSPQRERQSTTDPRSSRKRSRPGQRCPCRQSPGRNGLGGTASASVPSLVSVGRCRATDQPGSRVDWLLLQSFFEVSAHGSSSGTFERCRSASTRSGAVSGSSRTRCRSHCSSRAARADAAGSRANGCRRGRAGCPPCSRCTRCTWARSRARARRSRRQ